LKIDHTIRGRTSIAASDDQRKVDGTASTKTDAPKDENHVHISTLSSQAQALDGGGEIVDAAKVAEIKQAISEGRFKINPDVVADRLLEDVKELIQTKQPSSND
jgi:negative regulator of flagellin synthesis FlgM